MGLDFLVPIFGILIVLVPVTGLTAVLTLRLGGKPFVETLARELRGTDPTSSPDLVHELHGLREQVELLTGEVRRLSDAKAFDRELIGSGENRSGGALRD